jgi:hypothetical protein
MTDEVPEPLASAVACGPLVELSLAVGLRGTRPVAAWRHRKVGIASRLHGRGRTIGRDVVAPQPFGVCLAGFAGGQQN